MGILTIIAIVAGALTASVALTKAMARDMADKQAGLMIGKEGGAHDLPIIYGTRRVAPVTVWKQISRTGYRDLNATVADADARHINNHEARAGTRGDEDFLHRIDIWAQGPVNGIDNIEIDSDSIDLRRFAGNGYKNSDEPHYGGWHLFGNPGQSVPTRLTGMSDITTSMAGNGLAWSWNRFLYIAPNPQYRGDPNITAEVKGLSIWDPREGSDPSVKSWSENSALVLLDYLTADYGKNLALSDIDLDSFIAAANQCDIEYDIPDSLTGDGVTEYYNPRTGLYTVPTTDEPLAWYRPDMAESTRKRYTCNVALMPKNSTIDNVREILKTMKATLSYVQGKYVLKVEADDASVMAFDESNILGDISVAFGNRSKRMNRVTVKFPNQNTGYKDDTVAWPVKDSAEHIAYLTEDNGDDLHQEVELTGVTDFYQAQDMAEFIVKESRVHTVVEFKAQPSAIVIQPGDIITVTHPATSKLNNTLFRVRGIVVRSDLTVEVKAQLHDPSIYSWTVPDNEPLALKVESSAFDQPASISNFVGVSDTINNEDGTAITSVRLSWDSPDSGTVSADQINIGYKLSSATDYVYTTIAAGPLNYTVTGLKDNASYDFIINYRNILGNTSLDTTVTVSTDAAGTTLISSDLIARQDSADALAAATAAQTDAGIALNQVTETALPNLVADSSFEIQGPTGSFTSTNGYSFASGSGIELTSTESYLGSHAIKFNTAGLGTQNVDIIEIADVNAQPGDKFTLGMWIKTDVDMTVVVAGSGGFCSLISSADPDWQFVYVQDTTTVARASMRIQKRKNVSASANIYIDGLVLVQGHHDLSAATVSSYLADRTYRNELEQAAIAAAAETYTDTVTANFQTAAEVQTAIANDTTVIDGARITTGSIAAARLDITGKDISDLTNDSGFQTAGDVATLTAAYQTAAEVQAAIESDTTSIDGARITTGTVAAARISVSGKNISDLTNDAGYTDDSRADQAYVLANAAQTASEVQAAIAADTTVIDGSRITTGTINAARVSISGKNVSDLNNDAGYTDDFAANLAAAIAQGAQNTADAAQATADAAQTAAEVQAAIAADTTVIDGARITTGTILADKVSGGTLDFNDITADNLYVKQLSGDVNTMTPWTMASAYVITNTSTDGVAFSGLMPGSGDSDILRRPYVSCTGWGNFKSSRAYRISLHMKDLSATGGVTHVGTASAAGTSYAWGINVLKYVNVAGDVSQIAATSSKIFTSSTQNGTQTEIGSVSSGVYDAANNNTVILYWANPTPPNSATAGDHIHISQNSSGFTEVSHTFIQASSDFHPRNISLSGGMAYPTSGDIEFEIRVGMYNLNSASIPVVRSTTSITGDTIQALNGIYLSMR